MLILLSTGCCDNYKFINKKRAAAALAAAAAAAADTYRIT
jgi:hypothetical protein